MTNWSESINIAGLHRLYSSNSISLQDLAKAVVRKLKNTEAFLSSDPELIDIMCAFEAIDELAQVRDYSAVLDMLYQYGDEGHKLWIEARDVDVKEYDDVPVKKTRNPYDEDGEWVKYPNTNTTTSTTSTTSTTTSSTSNENPPQWSKDKVYEKGDTCSKNGFRYECLISCANVDPATNSYNKPGDCWKYVGSTYKVSFDPALAFTDRITCSVPPMARVYASTRKYHYMSEDDFNKKLTAFEINPANLPKDLYSYMKDCEEPYQEWLIERWHKNNLTFRPAPGV